MHRDKESLLINYCIGGRVISIFDFEKIKKFQIVLISYVLVIKSFYNSTVQYSVFTKYSIVA